MAKQTIDNGETGLSVRTKINDNFTEVYNRLSDVFNVKDFGAVGDGITDDRNAFQLAFNAANAAGGGIVYIPKGRYRKSDTVGNLWTIYSNTSLVGDGDQSVIFFDDKSSQARNGNDMIITNPSSETSNIEFKNFKVEGTLLTELNVTNRKQCFTGNRINGLRFENITIVGLRYMATAFNNVKNGIFTNNRLEYVAFDGLRTTSSQNVIFSNNTFKSVTDDCIAAHAYNVDSPRAGGFVITGNTMDACQGIKVLGAKEVVISNNVMRRTLRSPIHIETTGSSNIEGQTNTFSINIIGNTICDTFGNRGTNNAIYIIYQNGRSKQALVQQPGVSVEPYSYNYLTDVNNGTTVRSGMYGINISNNIITKTLGSVSKYSDYGYGELFDRSVSGLWEDPVVNDSSGLTHGLLIGSAVNALSITNNHIQGAEFTGITLINDSITSNILDFTNCIISENKIIDVKGFGLYITGTGSGQGASQILINDNIFDIDPFFRNTNHNSDNTWTATNVCYGINASGLRGLYASGNVFKNCSTTGLENTPNPIYSNSKNYIYADFTAGGLNNSGINKGVRMIPALKGTIVVPISGDPTSPNYGKALNDVISTSWSQPTNGYYIRGTFVDNANPVVLENSNGIKYSVSGWWRLTTGNSHVAGTDWLEVKNFDSFANTLIVTNLSATNTIYSKQHGDSSKWILEDFTIACSDEASVLTTTTSAVTFRVPFEMYLNSVKASVNVAPVGQTIIVDVKQNNTSIFSTKLSIDTGEETSKTATIPAVLNSTPTLLSDDDKIVVGIDQTGTTETGRGLKLTFKGYRA